MMRRGVLLVLAILLTTGSVATSQGSTQEAYLRLQEENRGLRQDLNMAQEKIILWERIGELSGFYTAEFKEKLKGNIEDEAVYAQRLSETVSSIQSLNIIRFKARQEATASRFFLAFSVGLIAIIALLLVQLIVRARYENGDNDDEEAFELNGLKEKFEKFISSREGEVEKTVAKLEKIIEGKELVIKRLYEDKKSFVDSNSELQMKLEDYHNGRVPVLERIEAKSLENIMPLALTIAEAKEDASINPSDQRRTRCGGVIFAKEYATHAKRCNVCFPGNVVKMRSGISEPQAPRVNSNSLLCGGTVGLV